MNHTEATVGDQQRTALEDWIVKHLETGKQFELGELARNATEQGIIASPSAVAWAIWHLVSAGKVQVTRDYFVAAA